MKLFLLVLLICILSAYAQDQKYCDGQLCGNQKHIACPGVAENRCPSDARQININAALQQIVLNNHNSYRNQLAGSGYSHLPSAVRMPTLEWDTEMAYIASKNAMQCIFEHDQCRNTANYKYSGQNICWAYNSNQNDEQFITQCLDSFWDEIKLASKSDIDKIGSNTGNIGHFTAMSQDRTNRVGCASVQYNKYERILVCNYSFTNILGSYVYKTGSPANGCITGSNSQYRNLCSTDEFVSPVPKTGELFPKVLKVGAVILEIKNLKIN